MSPFEEELRRALKREEPGEDFTAKVLAKIAQENGSIKVERRNILAHLRSLVLGQWQFAPALLFLFVVVSVFGYRQHQQTLRGEAAKEKLLSAMHIAGAELREAQSRVRRIQSPEVVVQ